MNDNLEWFIQQIGKEGLIVLPIVQELVKARPKAEQINLNSLIEKFIVLQTGDFTTVDNLYSRSKDVIGDDIGEFFQVQQDF